MEPLNQPSTFHRNSNENETGFSGKLEVFVHHARNIHNICIYDNQDVYAKFSLTYNPDETISTRVVVGGGKNPDFNQKLELKLNQIDAVLKCEIWMLSRLRNMLEDQLLGFALVPISHIVNQGGKISCQDFSLSSTDLFHSPAGTVQLSISLSNSPVSRAPLNSSANNFPCFSGNSSISSEVVLLDPNEYSRVEFPDVNADSEDRMMVSKYFNLNSDCESIAGHYRDHQALFLQLGSVSETGDGDCEMDGGDSSQENESRSNRNSNSGAVASTTTSLEDDPNTADSGRDPTEEKNLVGSVKQNRGDPGSGCGNMGRAFTGRVGNADPDPDQAAMQQQIVDMYMKSMQQFTESLAKMKLPMGLDPNPGPGGEDLGNVIRVTKNPSKSNVENKKDGSRVFYGSRAFF